MEKITCNITPVKICLFNNRGITISGLRVEDDYSYKKNDYCNRVSATIWAKSSMCWYEIVRKAESEDEDLRAIAAYDMELFNGAARTITDLLTTENFNYSLDDIIKGQQEQMNVEHLDEMLRDLDEAAHYLAGIEGAYEKMLTMLLYLGIASQDVVDYIHDQNK
jgi:hypothetical protein